MKGEYVVKINGDLITYDDYDDIPSTFENVISFNPDWPEPPHTVEDHEPVSYTHLTLPTICSV